MTSPTDLALLSRDELIALVQQLREQLAEQGQEIERLKGSGRERLSADSAETAALASAEPEPGSRDDLLAQLEKIYPEG
jgi:thiamine phosphate synthase YjbQ (UPF0047 family)